MPIALEHTPDIDPEETTEYLIEPGQGIILHDFTEGELQILAIGCFKDDSGGEVQILPAEGAMTGEIGATVQPKEMPEPLGIIKFGVGSIHEHDYVDEDGNLQHLRMHLVGGGAIRASGIIPRSLIHPN